MKIILKTVLSLLFISANLFCQVETELIVSDTTDECTVYLSDKSEYKDIRIVYIEDTNIVLVRDGMERNCSIEKLKTIKFNGKNGFLKGALYTGGTLALATLILTGITHDNESGKGFAFMVGSMTILPGALIGGIIGMLLQEDKYYDMTTDNIKTKIKRLRYIIKENH
jgi:hypothetical protein